MNKGNCLIYEGKFLVLAKKIADFGEYSVPIVHPFRKNRAGSPKKQSIPFRFLSAVSYNVSMHLMV